jgi:hypothetical protein
MQLVMLLACTFCFSQLKIPRNDPTDKGRAFCFTHLCYTLLGR